jgi:hypothetical protein
MQFIWSFSDELENCWYLYGDDTVQVSILYDVVYWLNEVRGFDCYLVDNL